MKHTILVFIILYALVIRGFGQVPYYDALALKKLNPTLDSGVIIFQTGIHLNAAEILKNYADNTTYGGIQRAFEGNPFIELPVIKLASSNPITGLPSLIKNVGGLDVTNIADGFAKFLVKRTKEELNAAFFRKFKDLITDPEYRDAQILFPQTYSTLQAIGSQIYNYEAYINGLRESFEKDLNSLLPNLKKVIEDGRYNAFFSAHPDLKAICLSSIYVGQGLMNKVNPGQIIADYPVNELLSDATLKNAKGAVQTLQLFSESIRSKGSAHYWVSGDSLKLLIQDPVTLTIYLGLVYQQAKSQMIEFKNGSKFHEILAKGNAERNAVIEYLKNFQKQADLVNSSINNLAGKERDKLTFADYYSFYNASLDLVEYATNVHKIPGLETLRPDEKLQNQILIARTGGNIALDINRRNYASAIINLYQLYNTSIIDDATTEKVKPFILKYGSFMAAVAQSQNSDDVASAIEAAALPSGSSIIKRETSFNVSLNAYIGLFTGYEKIKGVDKSGFNLNSYGVTAPIGISISRGHSVMFLGTGKKGWKEGKYGWSTSLFLSVVDIGALTAFRFTNDSTETVPNIQLKDIISPGVFLSIGIPKSPISVNIGYQVGPVLRQITATVNQYDKSYSRISISLCVDIPLLNFYSRSGGD